MTVTITTLAATAGLLNIAMREDAPTQPSRPEVLAASSAVADASNACDRPTLNKAITYYRQAYAKHRTSMWLTGPVPRAWYRDCRALTRRSIMWRDRAGAARLELGRWKAYHYDWPSWLPDKWQRIGACETGYGQRPGNWQHNSGAYQGAFGFANQSWDSFVPSASTAAGPYPPNADQATPRQQYEVALAIYRRYGLSGWGCRGA